MAKIQIKFGKYTPFGGLFFITDQFKRLVMPYVDNYLGQRCRLVGYQYGEILLAMACNFFTGGNRTEDINVLKKKLPQHPDFDLCSPDTVLRVLSELAVENISYSTSNGNSYKFNTAESLNGLLVYVAVKSGMLVPGRKYNLDFDHEFLESETWEALHTYKGFLGYGPGCAVLSDPMGGLDVIVGVENRDGNTPVKFHQEDTLLRILLNVIEAGMILKIYTIDVKAYTALYADYG